MRKTLPALLLATSALIAGEAKPLPRLQSEAEAKAFADKVMAKFVAEDYPGGFELLQSYWKLPPAEIGTFLMQTIQQRSVVKPRYGSPLAFEFISQKLTGQSFLKFQYAEKLQYTALRYTFIFYRAKDAWELQAFLWDDKMNLLFSE